jgi:hypothetical protein
MFVDYKQNKNEINMTKFIYIKKNQAGKFLEFNEQFDEKLFNNIGTTWEDYEADKWVMLSNNQVSFLKEHPGASEKEVWDMKMYPVEPIESDIPEPVEHPVATEHEETALERKLREIDEYDVYSFAIGDKDYWLDTQQRHEILEQVAAYRAAKEKEMTRWIDGDEYTFTLTQWIKIAQRITVYASKVENTKNTHKKNVSELQDEIEIDHYDFTTGYPEKLKFEMP